MVRDLNGKDGRAIIAKEWAILIFKLTAREVSD
jgi:hypothetical protein